MFVISDFCISNRNIPKIIADRILLYHLRPLTIVQDCLPFKISISENSGYRPWLWERAKGRSGLGQHTFGEREKTILKDAKGASDITCDNFAENKDCLLEALIEHTDYIRFAIYKTFVHCDFKNTHKNKRLIFTSNSSSKWTFKKFIN